MSASKRAFVLGASGAVGRCLVKYLVDSSGFSKIILLGRREIEVPYDGKVEQHVVDFEKIDEYGNILAGCDVGFCALGTTRSRSGAEGFYKVDHDYVVNTAKVAKKNGVNDFVLVSSMGANENSTFLYMQTKGKTEQDIATLNFNKFLIARPAFLEGTRDEFRLGEIIGKVLIKPLKLFSNRVAISAEDVAKAMVIGALSTDLQGKIIWENSILLEKARLGK